MDVAVVTYAGLPELDSYDAPLLPALAALGLEARATPLPEELRLAEQVLAAVDEPLLYARVDVATDNTGRTCLQELEATEPRLFLRLDPAAPARLAQAIVRKL